MPHGRPSKYKPEYVEQAGHLCRLGATDHEIGRFFGVCELTINRWKAQYPDFCKSIKTAKEEADTRVERSLYHRAVGYTFMSEKMFQHRGQIVRAPCVEHVPPDTTACIFWLKNRRPEAWRDKTEHQVGTQQYVIYAPHPVEDSEEWLRRYGPQDQVTGKDTKQ